MFFSKKTIAKGKCKACHSNTNISLKRYMIYLTFEPLLKDIMKGAKCESYGEKFDEVSLHYKDYTLAKLAEHRTVNQQKSTYNSILDWK